MCNFLCGGGTAGTIEINGVAYHSPTEDELKNDYIFLEPQGWEANGEDQIVYLQSGAKYQWPYDADGVNHYKIPYITPGNTDDITIYNGKTFWGRTGTLSTQEGVKEVNGFTYITDGRTASGPDLMKSLVVQSCEETVKFQGTKFLYFQSEDPNYINPNIIGLSFVDYSGEMDRSFVLSDTLVASEKYLHDESFNLELGAADRLTVDGIQLWNLPKLRISVAGSALATLDIQGVDFHGDENGITVVDIEARQIESLVLNINGESINSSQLNIKAQPGQPQGTAILLKALDSGKSGSLSKYSGSFTVSDIDLLTLNREAANVDEKSKAYYLPANTTLANIKVANESGSWSDYSGDVFVAAVVNGGEALLDAAKDVHETNVLLAYNNGKLNGSFSLVDDETTGISNEIKFDSVGVTSAVGKSYTYALSNIGKLDFYIDGYSRDEHSVKVSHQLKGIEVYESKVLNLTGSIGGTGEYLTLEKGIYGEGGVRVNDDSVVYLGGENAYAGFTIIGEGAQLHLESANAVMNSKDLIVEANGHLYLPESFDHEWDSVVFMGGIKNTPSAGTGGQETYTLIDGGTGGSVTAPSIKVAGVGKHMSFFQADNEQSDSGASTLSETDAGTDENSGSVPHHVVEVKNVKLSVLDGASFWVNALEGRGTTTAGDQFTQEMAVLKLGSGSSLTIEGHAADSADAPTSSHMYLGNGIVQVQEGGTLTLGADSAIHFSSHMPGFFEWEGSAEDPHHHASLELAKDSTLNVTLGEYNHIYSDKILEEGHEHFLIGTAWNERQSQTQTNAETNASSGEYFDGRAVNVQLTQAVLGKINNALATGDYGNPYVTAQHAQALSAFMQAAADKNINLTGTNSLSSLKTALVGDGMLSEEQFHQALTAMLSMSMNNNRHAAWQDYLLTSEAGGIYMTVEDTKQWGEVTDIRLSLNKETNEVVQLEAHSTENADRLMYLAANSGAYQIISNAINNYTMGTTTEESFRTAARIIDSAGQIATVGGAQTLAWDMLQTRRDSVSRHQDRLGGGELKNNLWVDVLYMNNKSHDMWNDLNGDREVKANLGGVIVGADAAVTDSLRVGAAFSWMDGSSETNLGMSEQTSTTNEVQGAAATFYGDYRFNDALRLKFDMGYQWGMNDLTMSFPTAMGIGEALKADVDTHTVQGNVTLEYGIDLAGGVSLVPFAGVGYTYLVTEGYTSTLGNKAAFRTESSKQQIVSVPVGVKLEGNLVNESTVFKPRLVAYVQPNFGDTEADNEVRGAGLTTVDRVNPEVIGEWSYGVSCGLAMELSDRVTLGFDYGFNGSNQSRNHSLTGSLRYAF